MAHKDASYINEAIFRRNKGNRMFVERALIKSRAYLSLTGVAPQVLMLFLERCQVEKLRGAKGKDGESWYVKNQGQIRFTYKEAQRDFGLSNGKFTRALDELIQKGFIDIAESGYGLHKMITKYAISERWRRYGTPEFEHRERVKASSSIGFQRKPKSGKPKPSETFLTCVNDAETTCVNDAVEKPNLRF